MPETPAAGIPRSAPTPATFVEDRTPVRRLEFVEVGPVSRRPSRQRAETSVAVAEFEPDDRGPEPAQPGPPETRWSLWGDLEG